MLARAGVAPAIRAVTQAPAVPLTKDLSKFIRFDTIREEVSALTKHTSRSLLRRLAKAGFSMEFVRKAVLPDWWDAACENDASVLPDAELRVGRFLGVPLSDLRDVAVPLEPLEAKGARLRKVNKIDEDRLEPAIHAGIRIAEAVVRSLRQPGGAMNPPPRDARDWLSHLRKTYNKVDLCAIASDLWMRGIPVVQVEDLPAPKFQGLACIVLGRPAVVVGHDLEAPPRLALFIAHEAGHIASGHCAAKAPVVDEDDEIPDTSTEERVADSFAWSVLAAGAELRDLDGNAPWKSVAERAAALESESGVDAGVLVWSWANRTRRYQDGQLALRALYLAQGGKRVLRELFDKHVDVEAAGETDQGLLNCVTGGVRRDAPAAG